MRWQSISKHVSKLMERTSGHALDNPFSDFSIIDLYVLRALMKDRIKHYMNSCLVETKTNAGFETLTWKSYNSCRGHC